MIRIGKLDIVSRTEWDAKLPRKNNIFDSTKERIVIHHSYSPTTKQFKGKATLQAIQKHHQITRGFIDIGYHLVVGPDFSIWEGRPFDSLGAHCAPPEDSDKAIFGNKGSFGICVIGNYDSEQVSTEMKRLIEKVIFEFRNHFGIKETEVYGHWECALPAPKTCPGRYLAEVLGMGERWDKSFAKK